jgi:hypothetical protein
LNNTGKWFDKPDLIIDPFLVGVWRGDPVGVVTAELQNCRTAELLRRVEDRARTGDLQIHNLAL